MSDTDGWYPFTPKGDAGPSVVGMEDWADRPAGRRGRILRDGARLVYGGRPIKLWGLNLCYGNCAPEKALADRRAAFYAKHGINSVRLHKFADGPGWAGIQSADSAVAFDPAALDRMDYQIARFKRAGIFVLLSASFGTIKLGPADREYVPFLDELGQFGPGRDRIETPHSALPYAPELQEVQIRQIVALLGHRNPYTGLTYAEDPVVAFVEISNEQSILFFTAMEPLKRSATIRRQAAERFSDWLKKKYGVSEKLRAAWGERAFDSFAGEGFPAGESLERRNILPLGSPWYWDPDQIHGSQQWRARRLLDTMEFLYELQCAFYDRYTAVVRRAGYRGELIGSNWQAGRSYSHYLNLHSDYRVGTIDRHNYFGGGSGRPGEKFDNATMLRAAGAATLSAGLQQAADRPFMLSEWIHVFPNEWGVEGPALMGAYGLGLQGWDASYLFQNGDEGRFSERIGRDQWDAVAPQILGVFPAVARQVLRGDVREAELRAPLSVDVPGLAQGKLGFTDSTAQAYDLKSFTTDRVPARTLAVARAAVRFTNTPRETPAFDLRPHEKDGFVVSATGELRWKEGAGEKLAGYFTLNTPGTKAVVGFARGQASRLGGVTITPRCRFAAIYVTAREKNATLDTARSWIIVALARARNTGMTLSPEEDRILERGGAPIRLEPVTAVISLAAPLARRVAVVHVLDHDGRRTGRTLPITGGRFTLDGARDRTPYYEVALG